MKKCPKCSYIYSDGVSKCPKCSTELIHYEEEPLLKTLYSKLKNSTFVSWAKKHFSFNIKLYKVLIIYIISAVVIVASYFVGTLKNYAEYDVYQKFQDRKDLFEDLTNAQAEYDKQQADKLAINNKIFELEKRIGEISAFEENKDNYISEIQNLENQFNDLISQKTQKEKTLNDIEYELSQY